MILNDKQIKEDIVELQNKMDVYSEDVFQTHRQFDESFRQLQETIQELTQRVTAIEEDLKSLKKDYNTTKYNVVYKKSKKKSS